MCSSAAIRTITQASSWTLPELLDRWDGETEGGKDSALLVRGATVMSVLGCLGLSPQTGDGCPPSGSGWSFSLLLSVVYLHWDSYCFLWLVTKGNGEHWHVASPQHLFVGWTKGCHGIRSSVALEPKSSATWLKSRRNHDSSLYYLSCCSNKILGNWQLMEVLAHGLRLQSITAEKSWPQGLEVVGRTVSEVRK